MADMFKDTPGASNCSDGMGVCKEILFMWTVGVNGICHPQEFGGLIGEGGFVGIYLEVNI